MRKYFLDLGFFSGYDDLQLGPNVMQLRMAWTAAVYVMISLGIFFRQYTDLPKVNFHPGMMNWPVLIGSFIIGLALLPLLMNRFNRRNRRGSKPNWEQVLLAFSFGFFVDLGGTSLLRLVKLIAG